MPAAVPSASRFAVETEPVAGTATGTVHDDGVTATGSRLATCLAAALAETPDGVIVDPSDVAFIVCTRSTVFFPMSARPASNLSLDAARSPNATARCRQELVGLNDLLIDRAEDDTADEADGPGHNGFGDAARPGVWSLGSQRREPVDAGA